MSIAKLENVDQSPVVFDGDLLHRFNRSGPRYTSYPTADRFTDAFTEDSYRQAMAARAELGSRGNLSAYIHIPFCDTVCYYCACNKIVTKDRRQAEVYLGYLEQEMALQAGLLGQGQQIEQLHLGGGTPTYLSEELLTRLMQSLRKYFSFAPDYVGEYSIEIDPRSVDAGKIGLLRELGFNRLSLGVQDFDSVVQKAVNRQQSLELTMTAVEAARQYHFRSVSFDLIYGLPHQTVMSFNQTLQQVIAADPDRIAIYNYAHLPHIFKPQRRIAVEDLPSLDTKLDILYLSIKRLTEAGYVYIGMDHFAKPDDDLAIAQRQGRLHRNFQGYSTHAGKDLLALGVSAIGAIGATYSQNEKTLVEYYQKLEQGHLPIARGITLSMDDLLRRTVIHGLMCHFALAKSAIEQAYPIHFDEYFAQEILDLQALQAHGLVELEGDWILVTLKGRLLIRNIAMVFDCYLPKNEEMPHLKHSRTI